MRLCIHILPSLFIATAVLMSLLFIDTQFLENVLSKSLFKLSMFSHTYNGIIIIFTLLHVHVN